MGGPYCWKLGWPSRSGVSDKNVDWNSWVPFREWQVMAHPSEFKLLYFQPQHSSRTWELRLLGVHDLEKTKNAWIPLSLDPAGLRPHSLAGKELKNWHRGSSVGNVTCGVERMEGRWAKERQNWVERACLLVCWGAASFSQMSLLCSSPLGPQVGWFKQQEFISPSSAPWEVRGQGTRTFGFSLGPSSDL